MLNNILKKGAVLVIILLFLGASILPSMGKTTLKKQGSMIYVARGDILFVGGDGPGNFSNIQEAIDAAKNGDSVYVYNGTYYEDIIIDKTINLIGEDKNTTIIDGGGINDVIYVSADFVNISGFKIKNATDTPRVGIHLTSVNNCTISNSNISDNFDGIRLDYSSHNTIKQNILYSNWGRSTYLVWDSNHNFVNKNKIIKSADIFIQESSEYNIVDDNILTHGSVTGGGGIGIHTSSYNLIINNTINDAVRAFRISHAFNNILAGNTIKNCELGIIPFGDEPFYYNMIYHNNFINNTQHANDPYDNIWYNATIMEGNYWDNYNGTDADGDGIGDTPYDIPGGINQDLYPLMYPWYPTHPETVYVDDNYNISTPGFGYDRFNRIQYGINEVLQNGTVYVYNGTYYENIVIDKTINLTGEEKNNTIIDGGGNNDVIYVITDGVNIIGFTIQNSGFIGYPNYDAGLDIRSNNNTIYNNNIRKDCFHGMYLHSSNNNVIDSNNISDNYVGIFVMNSSNYNFLSNNKILNNSYIGIRIYQSVSNIIIKNDVFTQGGYGIISEGSSYNNLIYHNNLINNSQNGYDEDKNTWDNGYPSGGNYWNDYIGEDNNGDGIGDISYNVSGGNNFDLYPLMNQWGKNPPVANFSYIIDGTTVQFNSSLSYDRDGVIISFEWDFGDGNNESGEIVNHTYSNIGKYNVTLTSTDNDGYKGNITKIIEITNHPPEAPIISGETKGRKGVEYEYTFNSSDIDGDPVMYFIDWGDNITEWTEYGDSSSEIKLKHTWNKRGGYTIKAKAKDINGAESDWETLEVSMPKNKPYINNFPLLSWFFEHFPNAFPILRHLIGLLSSI